MSFVEIALLNSAVSVKSRRRGRTDAWPVIEQFSIINQLEATRTSQLHYKNVLRNEKPEGTYKKPKYFISCTKVL